MKSPRWVKVDAATAFQAREWFSKFMRDGAMAEGERVSTPFIPGLTTRMVWTLMKVDFVGSEKVSLVFSGDFCGIPVYTLSVVDEYKSMALLLEEV